MNKKQDEVKLKELDFFSKSTVENFEREINSVLQLVRDQRLSYHNAKVRLLRGKDDIMSIFWYITTRLSIAYKDVVTLENYASLPTFKQRMEADPLSILKEKFAEYENGTIDFQEWERMAILCKNSLKSAPRRTRKQAYDILQRSKQETNEKQAQIIRELNSTLNEDSGEDFSEMKIKRIQKP